MKGLRGKTAIVTGAAHGIGKAIAMRLCREGVRVAFSDIDEDAALETAEEAYQEGFEVVVAQADVANTPQVHEMIEGVAAHWGQIDILVANAGIMDRAPFLEMSDKFWDRVHGINLKGAFVCGQAVARLDGGIENRGADHQRRVELWHFRGTRTGSLRRLESRSDQSDANHGH